jgi:hypothetical protein
MLENQLQAESYGIFNKQTWETVGSAEPHTQIS